MISFNFLVYLTVSSFLFAIIFSFSRKKFVQIFSEGLIFLGAIALLVYILTLWSFLKRPPLRTMGETRLLYSFLIISSGIAIRFIWNETWFMYFSGILSSVFLIINFMKPELFDKTLMPALQSPWFIPHVIIYIEGYAILGAASMYAIKWFIIDDDTISFKADKLVMLGFALLTLGMLMGAVWAKIAWGHYWAWDPKEIWALLTWLSYIFYIHLRFSNKKREKLAMTFLIINMFVVLICWFGVNYLPTAMNSVHTYMN